MREAPFGVPPVVYGGSGVSMRVGIRCLAVSACAGRGAATGRNRREGAYRLTRWSD